jgi:DNA-directed RNA polymerase subunit alpha
MPKQEMLDMVIGAGEAQRNARQAQAHTDAATRALEAGDRAAAIIELRKAVAADPNPQALFRLAFNLDLAGEDDEALAMYERAVEHRPAPINALINLDVLYEDMGDVARAERCLRQVLETAPNHPRARLYMKDVQASREMVINDEVDRDRLKRNAMLDIPVTDFELSVRARTCLKKMNIRTLGDLLRTTEAELLAYKNFGESSLLEIKQMLASKGMRLGQGVEDAHRQATSPSPSALARPSNSSTSRPSATSSATPRPNSWASRTSAQPPSRKSRTNSSSTAFPSANSTSDHAAPHSIPQPSHAPPKPAPSGLFLARWPEQGTPAHPAHRAHSADDSDPNP